MIEEQILECLNTIIDPCSSVAGAPAGLVDMGLVTSVQITDASDGAHVALTIAVTEPGCLMGGPFAAKAMELIQNLPGVGQVDVTADLGLDWTPALMSASYRHRLEEVRANRVHRATVRLSHPTIRPGIEKS
jgi:metal-sulfur cluster biosynthetic enzyme